MAQTPKKLLKEMDPRANAFSIDGSGSALLLIHGFTGTPSNMRPLGDRMHECFGWHVECPLLPGHGTTLEDLNRYGWNDWYQAARDAKNKLSLRFDSIHLAGLSMGALLCLEMYEKEPNNIESLNLLAPPIRLRKLKYRLGSWLSTFGWFRRRVPLLPKVVTPHPDHVAYNGYPTGALHEFGVLSNRARHSKSEIRLPTLVCYSAVDELVHPNSAKLILGRATHAESRAFVLSKSIHVLTLGDEREDLFRECETFYKDIGAISPSSVQSRPA